MPGNSGLQYREHRSCEPRGGLRESLRQVPEKLWGDDSDAGSGLDAGKF